MIGSASTSRRANAFAKALEERETGGTAAGHDEREPDGSRASTDTDRAGDGAERAAMLAIARSLRALPSPQLDPEVKTVHRAQLIAAMEAAFAERTAQGTAVPEQRATRGGRARHGRRLGALGRFRPRTRLSKGLAAGGLTVGVAAGAFTGVAAASSNALPGDSLYGLKRSMEDLRLTMASGDVERGQIYLRQASTRLKEARRLMERQRSGTLDAESLAEVRKALAGMEHDASAGHRLLSNAYRHDGSLAPLRSLSSFSEQHTEAWGKLRGKLPPQLSELGDKVSSVLDAIEDQVRPMKARLTEPGDDTDRKATAAPSVRDGATPSPSTTAPRAGADTDPTPRDGDDAPQPSEATESRGLLGDAPGLLDPAPGGTRKAPSDQGSGTDRSPDVTLPPLIPGLLPDLIPPQQQSDS